jgi:uncharacterized protein YhbP (UPF0306 family)
MNIIDEPVFDAEYDKEKIKSSQNPILANQIKTLVHQQSFCVLCTQGHNQPYGSLIAYAFTDDLKHFFFTTQTATRKFKLLSECQQVALVIDSRCQHQDNMTQIGAITITGKALRIQSGRDYAQGVNLLKTRHPYLAHFMDSLSTALFQIDVVRYFYVTRFQEVSQWIP